MMRAERDPDNLATATELMHECGVSFVNTDLPQTFTAAARATYAEYRARRTLSHGFSDVGDLDTFSDDDGGDSKS